MPRRREHYERAFASLLRERRIPYVSVDEAKRALLPAGAKLRAPDEAAEESDADAPALDLAPRRSLKSFDFVVYGEGRNLLVEVKGRQGPTAGALRRSRSPRIENWVTRDDLASLAAWERLFGAGFTAALVFVYACECAPDPGLFAETIERDAQWYGLRGVTVRAYAQAMKTRSPRWNTVDVPPDRFLKISASLNRLAAAPCES